MLYLSGMSRRNLEIAKATGIIQRVTDAGSQLLLVPRDQRAIT